MHAKTQKSILFVVLLAMSCSKKSSSDRSAAQDDTSADNVVSIVKDANSESRPNDNGEGIPGYTEASVPLPITGTNLVEIQISTNCVSFEAASCSQVRLSAKVKVNSAQPVRFAKDTLNALAIKSSAWDFKDLPPNTTCESIGGVFAFNPRCTISSGSLEDARIKATLSIVSNDGYSFQGASPDSKPASTSGGSGGPETHMIFVTNSVTPSTFGGVQSADNLCFNLAGQGTKTRLFVTATWKAVLSDSSEQAKDRIIILGDIRNTAGSLIGGSQSIFGGSLIAAINFDENGMPVADSTVWTGSNPDGTAAGGSNCTDWTGVGISGGVGSSVSTISSWLGASSSDCESSHPLFCISQ